MHLASITCFPVKSLGGHDLRSAVVEDRGLAGDRRWMVVDERNRFVTRREVPAMARLLVEATPTGLTIFGPGGGCKADVPDPAVPAVPAIVWRDAVAVQLASPAADAFLSEALGRAVRLAYQPDASIRPVDPRRAQPGEHVSLADGFPLLITTQGSLDALNARLASPVPMIRFRPNLVIARAQAWVEDSWTRLRIGTVELRVADPSTRCVVVTQQANTGERLEGNEPLATLKAMGRRTAAGIIFGRNAVACGPGQLSVGDSVQVL